MLLTHVSPICIAGHVFKSSSLEMSYFAVGVRGGTGPPTLTLIRNVLVGYPKNSRLGPSIEDALAMLNEGR